MPTFASLFALAAAFSLFGFPSAAIAAPYVSEVLPNTSDDATLEYFSVSDTACVPTPLSGYRIVDASGKAFSFPTDAASSRTPRRFSRPETKITLNNDFETLSIFDVSGVLVDSFSYSTSVKDRPIFRGIEIPACVPVDAPIFQASEPSVDAFSGGSVDSEGNPPPIETHSTITDSGSLEELGAQSVESEISQSGSVFENTDASASPSNSETSVGGASSDDASMVAAYGFPPTPADPQPTPAAAYASGSLPISDAPNPSADLATGSIPPSSVTVPISQTGTISIPLNSSNPPVTSAPSPAPSSTSRSFPERLIFVDSNGDSRFDSVRIFYSEALAGSASPNDFLLYSDTGGLFPFRVPTLSGYFSSAEIRDNELSLAFSWITLPKNSKPRIDGSTSSFFRIKSGSSGVLTRSSGLPVVPFTLTTSFSGYSGDRIFFEPAFPEPASEQEGSTASEDGVRESVTSSGTADSSRTTIVSRESDHAESIATSVSSAQSPVTDVRPAVAAFPPGFAVIPSAGIDLLPDGRYRFDCQSSSSCPVSFSVEGLPAKSKGYWEFSDGRKRFGASTTVLGRGSPADYRLAYVWSSNSGSARFPISIAVRPAPVQSVAAVRTVRTVGSETSSRQSTSSGSKKSPASSEGSKNSSKTPKSNGGNSSKTAEKGRAASTSSSGAAADSGISTPTAAVPMVSVGAVAMLIGLLGGGWFFASRKAWLPTESP